MNAYKWGIVPAITITTGGGVVNGGKVVVTKELPICNKK
jgi:hypothetical protein